MSKPILCLDFDGVCHSYTSGWMGADVINDPPVPGLFEFLEEAGEHFDIHVFSSRTHQKGGREAMQRWFHEHYRQWRAQQPPNNRIMPMLEFPTHKPPAMVTLDDRAMRFVGIFPEVHTLVNFKPWNKRSV